MLSNVELALTLSGISTSERKERAKKALDEVGLSEHIEKKPNQLSGGQQQRVAIARAIVNDPNIVFADEPTGALDTKTSIQIMDILKKIAKDRLVVMVTHNPEIAEKYATRIVNLKDAKIVGDSKPYKPKKDGANKFRKLLEKGKTAMSFKTALSLSFANLMGKKGRTFMTAFAGSIGIIGISAILALSTGTNEYIDHVQKNTLSQYPLYITRSKSFVSEFTDMAKGSGGLSNMIQEMRHNNQEAGKIGVRTFLSKMLATSGDNDLKSLKKFIDSNSTDMMENVDSIEYTYRAQPIIYANDKYGVREVFPSGTLTSTTIGTTGSGYTSASQNYSSGGMSSLSGFGSLPKSESLYKNVYSVAAGHWPENSHECVLVTNQDGTIYDLMLYILGFRDKKEMEDALDNFMKDEKVNLPENYDDLSYDDLLGLTFKIVNAYDMYEYNSAKGVWIDKSSNEAFAQQVVSAGKDLKIVGIVNPPEGSNVALSLSPGINFSYDLNEECINAAGTSQIVKDQMSKPEVDVLTGKTFVEEKKDMGFDTSDFMPAVNFDASSMKDIDIVGIIKTAMSSEAIGKIIENCTILDLKNPEVKNAIILTTDLYLVWAAEQPTPSEATPEIYFATEEGQNQIAMICAAASIASTPAIVEGIQGIVGQVVHGVTTAIAEKMMQAMSSIDMDFNISSDQMMQLAKLMSGSGSRSYEGNLADFGYADLENPVSIIIYPNDFYAKEIISDKIDGYNDEQQESGHEEKVISYTDYAKLLMSSLTTVIDMITAVLVAFVAISLVVSSIMIGIITYISVLERRREIGILRAIGARKRDIFNVFNAETFIIGLIAGFIGIGFTAIGCIPANIIAHAAFNVQYDIAILPI